MSAGRGVSEGVRLQVFVSSSSCGLRLTVVKNRRA
jgi:hypothetical protein